MEIRVLDETGDTTTVWDDPKQAEKVFAKFKQKGYGVFRMEDRKLIKEFDPEAKGLLITPPLAGG